MSAVPLQTVAAGALGLCFLEVILTSKYAPARLEAGAFSATAVLGRLVNPYVPLIGAAPPVVPGTDAAVGIQANEGGGEGPAPTTPAAATTASVNTVPSGVLFT